jgi:hypothetical protein
MDGDYQWRAGTLSARSDAAHLFHRPSHTNERARTTRRRRRPVCGAYAHGRNVSIYKVDPSNVPPGEVPDEPFQLELLSCDMYHKTMRARLAAPQNVGRPWARGVHKRLRARGAW